MSQIIGQIDSLAALLSKLRDNRINHINTLDEIISFQNDFQNKLNKSKDKVEKAFVSEIEQLKQSIITLETTYKGKLLIRERVLIKEKNEIDINIDHSSQNSTDIISEFFNFFKRLILKCRKYLLSNYFDAVKNLSYLVNKIQISIKKHRLQYFEKNFNSIVEKRNYKESKEIVKIKSILDENNTLIPGAIGEQKAVDELKKLPDSYVVINNCKIEFIPPIYYKKNDQNIKRIQADHIVVGPSGVFLIETKNDRISIQRGEFKAVKPRAPSKNTRMDVFRFF